MHFEKMELQNVGDGVLRKLFEKQLARVVADFNDPTKPWDKPRTIRLEVQFVPHEDGTAVAVVCGCDLRLPKSKGYISIAAVGEDGKLVQGIENQYRLGFGQEDKGVPVMGPRTNETRDEMFQYSADQALDAVLDGDRSAEESTQVAIQYKGRTVQTTVGGLRRAAERIESELPAAAGTESESDDDDASL